MAALKFPFYVFRNVRLEQTQPGFQKEHREQILAKPENLEIPPKNYRLGLVLILYCVSLALPGLHLVDGEIVEGWRLLLTAWYGALILEFPWFANLPFFLAVIFAAKGKKLAAGLAGCAAFLIGLLSLRSTMWIEHHTHIDHLGWGFYLWMASFLVLMSFLLPIKDRA